MPARLLRLLTVLAVLTGIGGVVPPEVGHAAGPSSFTGLGHTHSMNRVLHPGCHDYQYTYHIRPTTPQWSLETFLIDPRGHGLASGYFTSGDDKLDATSAFRVCKQITRTGRFRIRAKLTLQDGDDQTEGYIKDSAFRLCKAPKPYHRFPCYRPAS